MGFPVPAGKLGNAVLWVTNLVKNHEKLLAVIVAAALIWGVSGKVQDAIAAHDQKVYAARTEALQAQVDANAATAKANADAAAAYQKQAAQAQADNVRLQQQTVALLASLAQQKETDKHLPAPALAQRIETLATLPPNSVVPAPNDTFSVTQDGAVGIAVSLENVPALQSQLKNSQDEKANTAALLDTQTKRVDGLNTEIAGLHIEITKGDEACKAQVKTVKDAATKSKRKWFVAGYVAGLVTRGAIKLLSGV